MDKDDEEDFYWDFHELMVLLACVLCARDLRTSYTSYSINQAAFSRCNDTGKHSEAHSSESKVKIDITQRVDVGLAQQAFDIRLHFLLVEGPGQRTGGQLAGTCSSSSSSGFKTVRSCA